ncbi:NUDIX hydrolase [Candidatus Gracilibacteria bacterium]|nr:NUDIX hydrolase [Candidatus Gracilibacteria bacterium]
MNTTKKDPEVKSITTLFQGEHLAIEQATVQQDDNNQGKWEFIGRGPTVGAIVEHTQNNSFILISEYRVPFQQRIISLIGGMCDKNISRTQITAEEIREETGYTADHIEAITYNSPKSAGLTDETVDLFYATVSGTPQAQKLGSSEAIDVIEVAKSDIYKFLKQKEAQGIGVSSGIGDALFELLMRGKINISDLQG